MKEVEKKVEEQQETVKEVSSNSETPTWLAVFCHKLCFCSMLTDRPIQLIAMLSGLNLEEDSMAKIHAFIAMMKNNGGSLFRDGLVIPEDNGEVMLGDEDGDLDLVM